MLTPAVVFTLAAVGWLSWVGFQYWRFATVELPEITRLADLHGDILHLEEGLTLSARMVVRECLDTP